MEIGENVYIYAEGKYGPSKTHISQLLVLTWHKWILKFYESDVYSIYKSSPE